MSHFFISAIFIFSQWRVSRGSLPLPGHPEYIKVNERKEITAYVEEMTSEIIKDVDLRYEHASRYVEMHKGSTNFELGFIAANVHDKFTQMILQYKRFSEPKFFQKKDIRVHFLSLETVEGLYNEILHEKRLFYKSLQDVEDAKKTTVDPKIAALKQMMDAGMSVDPVILSKFGFGDADAAHYQKQPDGRRHVTGWHGDVTPPMLVKNTANAHALTLSDFHYKKHLRMNAFERRRANFTPELEGIEVDFTDIR